MCRLRLTTLIILGLFLPFGDLRAERVGFQFTGALTVAGSGNVTLFGISVPKNAPVTGAFSYDTATEVMGTGATQTYNQSIFGGYTLNINNGAILLSASDYTITVADDNGSPPSDSFSVDYNYDSTAAPPITPEKILVNGTQWTGTRAFIKYFLSWDSSTFMDSELTADRPLTPATPSVIAFVGSSTSPKFFSVTSTLAIVPPIGDYNRDGKLDGSDYTEWRKAFGESQPAFLYADGSNNGEVDAADYVVWRKRSALGNGFALPLPEPSCLVMGVIGLVILVWRAMPWQSDERRR